MAYTEDIVSGEDICKSSEKQEVFYMKTVMASAIRILGDSLKEILMEANFKFTKDGLFIKAIDNTKTQLIKSQLYASKMDEYRFNLDEPLYVGIDMQNFNKIIKCIKNDDVFVMYYDKMESDHLMIELHNKKNGIVKKYKLKVIDIDQVDVPNPNFSLDVYTVISMPSNTFKDYAREIYSLAESMEIIYTKGLMQFRGDGSSSTANYQIHLQHEADNDLQNGTPFLINLPKDSEHEIIQGVFSLKELCRFTKCTNLCVSMKIYIANGKALVLNYTNADLGEIYLCLAPIGN